MHKKLLLSIIQIHVLAKINCSIYSSTSGNTRTNIIVVIMD